MAIALMRGLHDGGALSCSKHFPGHGDTEKDSHLELPIARRSRAELERTDLAFFRAAIAASVPMLMSAHVLYQALDPEHPATLSRTILTDLLRGELTFDGVVPATTWRCAPSSTIGSIGDAAVATLLLASADALLVCKELQRAVGGVRRDRGRSSEGPNVAVTIRPLLGRRPRRLVG